MSGMCPRCNTRCYENERPGAIQAGGEQLYFHPGCFNCKQCKKGLTLPTYVPDNDTKDVYCKSCHGSLFGPTGFRGGGGSAGATIGVVTHSAVDSGGMTVDGKATPSAGSGGTKASAGETPKFCSECGAKQSGGKFCQECGNKF